ncbi:hypothetical protein B1H10_01795 [candidate division KSB1 bacterium 4484_188]|nr:MAG: hypothetical protein B1H10_01795 [candidate division KSB1 bacterium 4484_188]
MTTKIEKQKQIFTLLNDKFSDLFAQEPGVSAPSHANPAEPKQTQLIDKVYNFYKSIIQNINGGFRGRRYFPEISAGYVYSGQTH